MVLLKNADETLQRFIEQSFEQTQMLDEDMAGCATLEESLVM